MKNIQSVASKEKTSTNKKGTLSISNIAIFERLIIVEQSVKYAREEIHVLRTETSTRFEEINKRISTIQISIGLGVALVLVFLSLSTFLF